MIGGEFEIDWTGKGVFVPDTDTYYYASGRTALYQILRSLKPQRKALWMPDWLCHTMVDAVEKAGMEVRFYELNARFKASVEALECSGFRDGEAMLMVNYFGLQDLTAAAKAVKEAFPGAKVIEDDVQAYWVFSEKENPYADYRFTSVRKAFAVPDGGFVKTGFSMPVVTAHNTFSPLKMKAGVLKRHRGEDGVCDEDYLSLFTQGEALINDNYDSVMTQDAKALFAGTDFERARLQRQTNAKQLVDGLRSFGLAPMMAVTADSVPLFVPVCLKNRDEVRRRLFRHEVFCPVHWPLEGVCLKNGADMEAHELSLIVDQRYGQEEMDVILSIIKSNV